jgi:hypothetical protein
MLVVFFLSFSCLALAAEPVRSYPHLESTLKEALASYESLNDYEAVFHKQELDKDGKMGPKETMFLKFEKPFKIFLGWIDSYKKGLQVIYERGKHNGKLGIHKPGLGLGLVPVVYLAQDSPWVREGSASYNIEDAGIGSFLDGYVKSIVKSASTHSLVASIDEVSKGIRVEVEFKDSKDDETYFAKRIVTYLDYKTKLPIEIELYDWNNKPSGFYKYENLKLNVGADHSQFKKYINKHLYRAYQSEQKSSSTSTKSK